MKFAVTALLFLISAMAADALSYRYNYLRRGSYLSHDSRNDDHGSRGYNDDRGSQGYNDHRSRGYNRNGNRGYNDNRYSTVQKNINSRTDLDERIYAARKYYTNNGNGRKYYNANTNGGNIYAPKKRSNGNRKYQRASSDSNDNSDSQQNAASKHSNGGRKLYAVRYHTGNGGRKYQRANSGSNDYDASGSKQYATRNYFNSKRYVGGNNHRVNRKDDSDKSDSGNHSNEDKRYNGAHNYYGKRRAPTYYGALNRYNNPYNKYPTFRKAIPFYKI